MEQNNRKRKCNSYNNESYFENITTCTNKKIKTLDINHLNSRIDKIESSIDLLLLHVKNIDTSLKYITKNIKKDDINLDSIKKIVNDIEIKSNLLDDKFYGESNNIKNIPIGTNNINILKEENNSYFN
tara:strand:+ start:111 stop:494 length:384 start_codon:yes stop_codon:yes gene_type:complete